MTATPSAAPRLRIIAINDVYTLENLPRLGTLVATLAAADPVPCTLFTLAGDFLAPSLLSSLDSGHGMVDVMNALGVTHVTFGNHEDDLDVPTLQLRMAELDAVWLGTNVPDFASPLPASDRVTVAPGLDVALIGVVSDDPAIYRQPPFGGVPVLPPIPTVIASAQTLLAAGAAAVIPLTHLAVADDRALIAAATAALPRPFPIILGGHDHVPIVEPPGGPGGAGTWLVKAGQDATHALICELSWPAGPAAAAEVTVRLEPVAGYPEDAALRALVDHHMAPVHALHLAALLCIPEGQELSSVGARHQPSTLATLLCTAIRDATRADLCLINGGGVRGVSTYRGRFTYADLETELPFDNEIVSVPLPGAVLAEAVASSRSHAPADFSGYLHADDAVLIDASARITHAAGAPFDPARTYRVAIMRDLLVGMDDIEPLVAWARANPDSVPPEGAGRAIKTVVVDAFGAMLVRELGGPDAMASVDTNHDGVLSVAEIAAGIARLHGCG